MARDELLVVVPVAELRALGPAAGFRAGVEQVLDLAFRPGVARTMPRSLAEHDPQFKQLVAYVVLRHGDRVFHYQRSPRAGEPRLAGRRSIGVGGHLNADDWGHEPTPAALERAIARELAEEVELREAPSIRYLGLIDEDTEPVSQVHLGIVALADLERPAVQLRDPTLRDARFDRPSDLSRQLHAFEGWSKLALQAIESGE